MPGHVRVIVRKGAARLIVQRGWETRKDLKKIYNTRNPTHFPVRIIVSRARAYTMPRSSDVQEKNRVE